MTDKIARSRLLTNDEVADLLGVSRSTLAIWRSTERYGLPYVKAGRLVRYKEADVLRFIERRTVRPEIEVAAL